ncbi:MAG: VWA domain-containing protein [Spirulina sp. SIO3F2]|nr:VWA domain-containing protein [Spirulina sp. SIO3F2]
MAISLEKIEQKAPSLINLAKTADKSISKVNLTKHRAKVALCLDISGSMYDLYESGKIQQFAERILALGCRFDDDGAIEIFLFGQKAHHAGEMTLENFGNCIGQLRQRYRFEGATNYGEAIAAIQNFYFPRQQVPQPGFWQRLVGGQPNAPAPEPIAGQEPVYVMFVTDGAATDAAKAQTDLTLASYAPIFWQFMAIGIGEFPFLQHLDDLAGRFIDNADFFSVGDPLETPDDQLYDLLMTEYPDWVKQAQAQGLLV